MPPRSKVVTLLPPDIRAEVERRMLEKGFTDYRGLAEWVGEQGYQISDESLWRYGKAFQRQLADSEFALRQARALDGVAQDSQSQLITVLTHLFEQKIFSAVIEVERLKYSDLTRLAHAAADLSRAATSRRRWLPAPMEQQKQKMRRGLSNETSQALRNALLGIAPYNPGQSSTASALNPTPEGSCKAEAKPEDERDWPAKRRSEE
jgi:hypothetical protein